MAALGRERGWRYAPQGFFDQPVDPWIRLRLPEWNLVAGYHVQMVWEGEHMTEMGIGLYVATDQVRFERGDQAMALIDVPLIVFSEVMRDVDLFVGRASVGMDALWEDRGEQTMFRDYRHHFGLGELGAPAQSRRAVLERLLPRLKIGPKCRLEDRFLLVEGKLKTYKIHLGSGNILMSPRDQYLCIVPGGSGPSLGYVPFEGDLVLSTILSKATMLVDDDKITDRTILLQLRAH
jgi:hypothetical protein